MEPDIIKIIKENNELLKENLNLSRKNTKKIKRIQSYIRRTFIARIFYWLIIVLVTGGALYFVRPYVQKAVSSYDSIQSEIETTTNILGDPSSLFKDVGVLSKIFEVFSEKDILTTESL
ncbi:MAG: hypothetical protein LR005_02225 [Candidatus Pacebacteria bacterium]|nr:hypothetical protein [Candidatus Paceibacterota bacterium]